MQISSIYLGSIDSYGLWAIQVIALICACWRADWLAFKRVPLRQHALMGFLVGLCLMWSLRFEVLPGLHLHLSLMLAVALVFGWCFSILVGHLALLLIAAIGPGDGSALPWDALFTVIIPVTLAFVLLRLLDCLPTRNLFVYILGLGFFGALLVSLLNGLLLLAYFALFQSPSDFDVLLNHILFAIPLVYSEAFINGVLVTAITVYAPDLVKTFDDQRFLGRGR